MRKFGDWFETLDLVVQKGIIGWFYVSIASLLISFAIPNLTLLLAIAVLVSAFALGFWVWR